MGFWAQHAAAALMGSYVHSTMLCVMQAAPLMLFLGEMFVPFILFMVKSTSDKLQLCAAVLCPKCWVLWGFCSLTFGLSKTQDLGLCVCAAFKEMKYLVQTKGL